MERMMSALAELTAGIIPGMDFVEEVIPLSEGELALLRPRDSEALLREEAFEHEELLPYWAELWPSGVALARVLRGRSLRGARTLELGCGLGAASIAAALAGGRVLATDWSEPALAMTRRNAERNGAAVETARCTFFDAPRLRGKHAWDLVLAADVLYERRNVPLLLDVLPRLLAPGGEALLADPGRPATPEFLLRARSSWDIRTTGVDKVAVHRLRPLA
jgi:predicted nicotinamide N-methyase